MEPPKRGFAMVPHRMTLDIEGISDVTVRLYAALHSLARGSGNVKGRTVKEITDLIRISPATFKRSMNELEAGNYVVRHNKQSRWFEVEFLPETGAVLAHPRASKSLTHERVKGRTRSPMSGSLAHQRATTSRALPISEFDKGIDKERLSTVSPIKKVEEGVMESDADRISAWVYERILKDFPGDECLAETASIQATGWVRDEGYTPDQVKVALIEVIGKGIRPIGLMSYTHKVMGSNRARASAPPPPAPLAMAVGAPSPGFQHKTKAQRDAEVSDRRRAAIMQMFPIPAKEDHIEG